MRKHARTDANQEDIVDALRKAGASVHVTSALGDGFADLVVGYRGENFLMEVKDGTKPAAKRALTPKEKEFSDGWRGRYNVVESVKEALDLILHNHRGRRDLCCWVLASIVDDYARTNPKTEVGVVVESIMYRAAIRDMIASMAPAGTRAMMTTWVLNYRNGSNVRFMVVADPTVPNGRMWEGIGFGMLIRHRDGQDPIFTRATVRQLAYSIDRELIEL